MGPTPSKPQTTPVISVNAGSPAIIHSNDDKVADTLKLIENINTVLKHMKKTIEGNRMIRNGLFRALFKDLESLNDILNSQRMHVCYVVGITGSGKSSLINKISNTNECKVYDGPDVGTTAFKIISAPEVNTVFIDTIGFRSDLDLVRKFAQQFKVGGLPDLILGNESDSVCSHINNQELRNDLDYMSKQRWIIANKIIAGFSTASAVVSFLPIADIVIVTILQEWMYKMLACFSIDPTRTPDTFKTVHCAVQDAGMDVREVALVLGGIFQLSLVGYLVGSGICAPTAASSTAVLGWTSYYYFIGKTSPEEHGKCT